MFVLYVFLLLTAVIVPCSKANEPNPVSGKTEQFQSELEQGLGKTIQLNDSDEPRERFVDFGEFEKEQFDDGDQNSDTEFKALKGRKRRQAVNSQSLLQSLTQECDGVTLRWKRPNFPYSNAFHSSNEEFSHYNIYRETNFFSSVRNLKPFASGKDYPKLQTLKTTKWTDKFAPSGSQLYYAVTVVNHRDEETQIVNPKQISFFSMINQVAGNPTRIIPNAIKGDVIHHSVAYNKFRNEYFVAFDVDQNNDRTPDRVYGLRIDKRGRILDRRIVDFTINQGRIEQGKPSVAFNAATREYLVAFEFRSRFIRRGKHVIIGQRVFEDKSFKKERPFIILNGNGNNGFASVIDPKLIYNSGSGGYAMTAMLIAPPKTAFVVFLKADGKASSLARLYPGRVTDANLFMDTINSEVYIVYQLPQQAVTVTKKFQSGGLKRLRNYPYVIVATKASSSGQLLTLHDPNSKRHLVGYSREQNANIAGYFDTKRGWLTVLWNNQEKGKKFISSSSIFGVPGRFDSEKNVHDCPSHVNVENPSACFLPNNNGHVLMWESGSKIDGYVVQDGTFEPVLGLQRRPRVIYNSRDNQVLVVYQQRVLGTISLFVKTVYPGYRATCRKSCGSNERCALKDTCVRRNYVKPKKTWDCSKNNGGCSDVCKSKSNGRKCSCLSSKRLALDGRTCFPRASKADVSLLFSTPDSIWSAKVYYAEKRTKFSRVPIQGQSIIAFFYNKKDKFLYWADAGAGRIFRSRLDGANKQVVVDTNVVVPDGMIIDPVAKRLYWSDVSFGAVFRSPLSGGSPSSFVSGLDKPRALALHQKKKWLFWTSWGFSPQIERISIDGSGRTILISSGLKWPNGLAVDGNTLYWTDAHFDKIEKSDLSGFNRVTVTKKGVVHPYGLAIASNRLYWTDWSGHIRSVDKSQTHLVPDTIAAGLTKPFLVQIYDGTSVRKARFCDDPGVPSNGGRNPPPPRSGGKYKVGDQILLTCNPGFVHLGSNSRQCLRSGKWSGNDTQCKALPVFVKFPTNKTVDLNYGATIQCLAESKSGDKPKITWYKNGKVLPVAPQRYYMDQVRGVLLIFNVVVDDAGTYTCEASNDAGKISASMYLTVKYKVQACGKAKFSTRAKIIGGQRATPGSIPWQIMLRNKYTKKPFCGGALLNARWAVTAAHCLNPFKSRLSTVQVILGEYDYTKKEKNEQKMKIDRVHMHPQYSSFSSTFDSDIALIRFTKQAIFTDYVMPVCLPSTSSDFELFKANNTARVSGWGARNLKKRRPRVVKKLHEVEVQTVSHQTCVKSHSKYRVTANMLCAGRADGKGDACKGDSGGPLTAENPKTGKTVLIGVVSWGESCGKKNQYGVYTKVKNFLAWIDGHIKHV